MNPMISRFILLAFLLVGFGTSKGIAQSTSAEEECRYAGVERSCANLDFWDSSICRFPMCADKAESHRNLSRQIAHAPPDQRNALSEKRQAVYDELVDCQRNNYPPLKSGIETNILDVVDVDVETAKKLLATGTAVDWDGYMHKAFATINQSWASALAAYKREHPRSWPELEQQMEANPTTADFTLNLVAYGNGEAYIDSIVVEGPAADLAQDALKGAAVKDLMQPSHRLRAIRYREASFSDMGKSVPDHAHFIEVDCRLYRYISAKKLKGARKVKPRNF